MSDPRPAFPLADQIALLLLAAVALTAALTFRDYGLGWDDYTQSQYGNLLLSLYGSGFKDQSALHFVNLYRYGGGFDMAAALAAKLLPFGLIETRRLVGAAVGLIGLAATWRLGRRLGGPLAGLSALTLLAACPLYYGHMFMNSKDAPFAVAMLVTLLGIVHALDEYPAPSARTLLLMGAALGAAFGSRILAVLAAPPMIAAVLLIVAVEARTLDRRQAAARLGQFLRRLLPALALAYLIMALLWPWSVVSPLNPLRAAIYFDSFFEAPWHELYEGALLEVPNMPATYLPHLVALKLPLLMLALGIAGLAAALIAAVRPSVKLTRRAGLLVVALAAILPVTIAMVNRPAFYNGIRQFLFIVPPFAVLGGLAAAWLIERTAARGRALTVAFVCGLAAGLVVPVIGMVRLHPYQYVYYNPLTGGVPGAKGRYMLDYWGLAFKQAALALRARLATSHAVKPADRPWRVAVCGPQPPAQVVLGPDFHTTDQPRGADFAMMLGTFYCRALNAPVLAEIKREGVVFARVYDLREGDVNKLLTMPPPK